MPHTRAARLRALKEAAECANMQQMPHGTTNSGWSDYLGWDLPELTYQSDGMACYPSDRTLSSGAFQTPTAAVNSLQDTICIPSSTADFYDLQPWDLTSAQGSLSMAPETIIQPPRSANDYTSYESTSQGDESQLAPQRYDCQPRPPKVIRRASSFSDQVSSQKSSEEPATDLTEESDEASTPSSEVESERISNAKFDANKKRKIAHSVIEKKYRSRIVDGMAELRHCVPSTARFRSDFHSKRPKSQQVSDDTTSNHASSKVATLSDAVQYVKALELQNQVLHGELNVMQRRNHTLQKIALSKT